ncbi:MAG: glycoside hydrolase TIM-barrel-like domain-containing protein [Myxococcales bacterium]|nr:glycoside hydrolase TIM-barrel-like domain-containing protein [Myxococcales bacterium]
MVSPTPTRRAALAALAAAPFAAAPFAATPAPATSPVAGLSPPRKRDASFHRGASLGLFAREGDAAYRRSIYAAFLDEMALAGVTHVQLVTRWAQADVRATTIAPDGEDDDDTLRWAIGAAAARGMRTFLMPILHVRHRPPGEWRGTLAPTDPAAWWSAYRRFILHYARLAAATGVALYAVGSELVSTEQQTDRWRALIAAVRAVYPGQLTYSANWDHFEPVSFWDALDVAGLNAYHELSPRPNPTEAELLAGWRPFVQRVRHWALMTGKPYLFTEIGYPATAHAAARPWDHALRGAPDPDLQLRCYRALYETWQQDPRLVGLYLWNWFGHGGPDDPGYTPRGKPAMHVIDHWYRGAR